MKNKKESIKTVKQLGMALLHSSIIVFVAESILRENIASAWGWILINPLSVLINVLLVATLYLAGVAIVNASKPSAVMVYTLGSLFTAINYFKYKYLGQYFYPWDLDSGPELVGVADVYFSGNRKYILVVLAIVVVGLIGLGIWALVKRFRSVKQEGHPLAFRLGVILVAGFIGFTIAMNNESQFEKPLRAMGIINYGWNQSTNYAQNGSLLSFLFSISSTGIEKPEGYSEAMVAEACKTIGMEKTSGKTDKVKPNVIIIMNESYWDPTQLSEVRFNIDPLKSVRGQEMDTFVSPTFGGVTCNVEFEFLTGMNTRFMPQGVIPYQQYVKKKVSALPWEFQANGYKTLSIHPYQEWFWNRKMVYPLIGFQESIYEKQMTHKEQAGFYIGDNAVVDQVMDSIEKTEKPLFVFAITMQNHGPYGDDRYKKKNHIEVDVKDPDSKEMLETYSQGAEDASKAYMKLIDEVKKSKEPTIVIQFGDHLPGLGDSYKVYRETNFIGKESTTYGAMKLGERIKMKKTPLLHFSNYKTFDLPNIVSPSMLSTYVIKESGIQASSYFRVLGSLAEKYPVIASEFLVNAKGEVIQEGNNPLVKQYGILQYDQLFGKNYLAKVKPDTFITKNTVTKP